MNLLQKFFKVIYRKPKHIIIVSGLPRSGTSMMMQVLKAGGIEPVTDNERMPDQDNSKGYYEHNGAKALAKGQYDCLVNAEGRSVKVVSTLLKHLPAERHYKVIFMHRDLDEVLASQATMLKNLQQEASSEVADDKLKTLYIKHINTVEKWLKESANIDVLNVNYTDVLADPITLIDSIAYFVDIESGKDNMVDCIDQNMRHQHKT
jgi:hypothetical protein